MAWSAMDHARVLKQQRMSKRSLVLETKDDEAQRRLLSDIGDDSGIVHLSTHKRAVATAAADQTRVTQ